MKAFFSSILLLCFLSISNLIFAQNGLKADFYNGTNFDHYVSTRIDKNIDYYWNDSPPVEGINPHSCSIRWTGKLKAPKTGTYKFSARVDDGIQVWVGDVLVIDNWQLNDVGRSEGSIKMKAGKFYDLKVEYFNALIEGEITLLWEIPPPEDQGWFSSWWNESTPKIISPQYFFHPPLEEKPPFVEVQTEPTPEPTKIETKPAVSPPKKIEPNAYQQYIPKNIEFEQAKSEILPSSFSDLDILANFLVLNKKYQLTIEGHTDTPGDANKNLVLSQKRANAVAAYLVKKGVNHERLEAKGYGGSHPLIKSKGKKYHPENRRVEFILR